MARRSVPPAQDDLELVPSEEFVPTLDDARLVDLEAEEESPFLRAQKRVPVRRGSLPKKAVTKLKLLGIAASVMTLAAAFAAMGYHYGAHSWRFLIQSSDDIEITGLHNVSRPQIMDVLGGDLGRNVFFVPLDERKQQLERIPWVESAAVMRFLPNRLKVEIQERTPVAFVRMGERICLIDGSGVVMELPVQGQQRYSFPVIVGTGESEPLSTRASRMRIYSELIRDLDSGGGNYSQDVSEVDLSDPEDVKVLINDPSGAVLVHLGRSHFLDRYKIYVAHVGEWRQQFRKLDSVDLRYGQQIIVNPDTRTAAQKPLPAPAVRAAIAAGVSPAALNDTELKRASVHTRTAVSKKGTARRGRRHKRVVSQAQRD
jgi:cell division protein FtsQ